MGRRNLKFKFLLFKFYFDKGWALTNYFKYAFAFSGIFNIIDKNTAIVIAVIYGFSCFLFGYFWTKFKMVDIENDVNNAFNPFVRRMLKVTSKNKKFK